MQWTNVRRDIKSEGWPPIARVVLTIIVVAGLAIDAYVHFHLASTYDAIKTSTLSQGDLFRVEGVAAILAGLAVIVRPDRYSAIFACVVAGGGLAAVLVYRYINIKAIGPIPGMYEPIWYPEKTRSAYGEGIAAVAALALVFLPVPAKAAATVRGR